MPTNRSYGLMVMMPACHAGGEGSIPSGTAKCRSRTTASTSAFQAENMGSTPICGSNLAGE